MPADSRRVPAAPPPRAAGRLVPRGAPVVGLAIGFVLTTEEVVGPKLGLVVAAAAARRTIAES